MRNVQFMVLATIPNFNKKQSYSRLNLAKSIKPAIKEAIAVAVNKTVNTTTTRKKSNSNPELKAARKESKWMNGTKPTLLVSTRLV